MPKKATMTQKFRATVDGGIPLGRASNLPAIMQLALPELKRGRRVYVRDTGKPNVVTFTGFPPEAVTHNQLGDITTNPDWVIKAQRLLTY